MKTPYLNWTIPDVLSDSGPGYAQTINNVILSIDSFLGSAFTPSQLNINADLDFQSNDAINLRSVRLLSAGQLTDPSDVGCIYNLSGNLYYNDTAQNKIQLTQNGSLNTGINGNIGGMAGTSASVSFNSIDNAYSFYAAPTRLAGINALTGNFGSVFVSGTISAAQASFTSASYGNIQNLTGSLVQATTVSGNLGQFTTVNVGTLNPTSIPKTNVTQLTASGVQVNGTVYATSAVANNVYANGANISGQTLTQGLVSSTTAASIFSGAVTVTQNAVVNGGLSVGGTTSAGVVNASSLSTTGNASVGGTLGITGTTTAATVNATSLNASNAATVTNTLTVGSSKVVANPANVGTTQTMLTVAGDIAAQGGFRQQVGPATFYSTSNCTANTPYSVRQLMDPSQTSLQWQWVAPTQGSVTNIQVTYILPNTGTYTVLVSKNFNSFFYYPVMNPSNLVGYTTAFSKDTYTFAAGDVINFQVQASITTPIACFIWLTVEC